MSLSTEEFRSHSEYISRMRVILEDPVMQMWLEALDEDALVKKPIPAGLQPHEMQVILGRVTGYQIYRDNFRLGAQGLETQHFDGEPTYLPPETAVGE